MGGNKNKAFCPVSRVQLWWLAGWRMADRPQPQLPKPHTERGTWLYTQTKI